MNETNAKIIKIKTPNSLNNYTKKLCIPLVSKIFKSATLFAYYVNAKLTN